MQDAKTGGSRWVPDIREDEITEFQEQNGDETATYKAVNVHPIISRVLDKIAFFRTHVSAVWYNKLANKTVKDKLDEIDTSISSLNSSCLKVRVAKMLSTGAWMEPNTVKSIDIDVPYQDDDICIAFNSNNTGASNLIYTPCVDNKKWLVTVNANSKGGGPDTFRVIILNT